MTTSTASNPALAGLTVLVVEDEYLIAMEIAALLRNHGAQVLGPVPDEARTRALVSEQTPDCVLMDINLKGERVFDLAQHLRDRGLTVIFTTGYDATVLPEPLRSAPRLQKPLDSRALIAMVKLEATLPHRDLADPVR
jgi:DNA-binding response OmpR family regulator